MRLIKVGLNSAAHLLELDFGGGPVVGDGGCGGPKGVLGDLRGRLPAGVFDDGLDLRKGERIGLRLRLRGRSWEKAR